MGPSDIKHFREKRLHMTLDELAAELEVSRTTIWRWEQPATSAHHRSAPPFLIRALRDVEREKQKKKR